MPAQRVDAAASTKETCRHCGSPVPADSARDGFCCAGCETVFALLKDEGLDRYYVLAGKDVAPVAAVGHARSFAWLEPLLDRSEARPGTLCELELDVQGIHCAACVWLMNELFRRQGGGADITVNPALGKVRMRWRRGRFDVPAFLRKVESFGYLFGPGRKQADRTSLDLPIRLGVSAAITMNVMIFSVSFYLGLTPEDGRLFPLFTRLSLWLSTLLVLVGGWPFFRAAVQGLRRGVLHLDLPIALGIALVYVTSLLQARTGRGDLAYFDTLNTFVTLMLLGRWLQQRVVERNRRYLLEDDGAEGLFVRRVEGSTVRNVPAARIEAGDELLVAPGDLAPVDATLLDPRCRISTAWITGEADVTEATEGTLIPAGACNEGGTAVRLRARTAFTDSPLVALLQRPPSDRAPRFTRFWSTLSRGWVVGVLALSALALWLWWPAGPDRAVEVAAALLVVTCPCALGIATPLAYELVQSRLRRAGVFVRSLDLLDRLTRVRKVLFDKTGTLTLGRLELVDPGALRALSADERDRLFDMAARSNHPVSRCLADALQREGARFTGSAQVREHPGEGLELVTGGHTYRLGRPRWALGHDGGGVRGTAFSRDGLLLAAFQTRESLRPDARRELQALADDGQEIWLVSGDAPGRVEALAQTLGVPPERALASQRPEDKARVVAAIDRQDTLFLGDGVNDSLAFDAAYCAGTPAVERPVMPGKADFFLLGEGLAGVREALRSAQDLRRAVRRILGLALAYNLAAVAVCLAGGMTPLRAAIAMPLSSLTVIALAVLSLSGRRRRASARSVLTPRPMQEVPA